MRALIALALCATVPASAQTSSFTGVAASSRGALVINSTNLTAQNYTGGAAITFDSEVYDTDAIHSTSSNTSRLTVPAGVTKVRLVGAVGGSAVTANTVVIISFSKDGGGLDGSPNFDGAGFQIIDTANITPRASVSSGVINVTPGEYYELVWRTVGDTSSDVLEATTFFGMEIIQ